MRVGPLTQSTNTARRSPRSPSSPKQSSQPPCALRCHTVSGIAWPRDTRILHCISHPAGAISHARYLYSCNIVSVPKRSALESSRRELSEDVSVGIGTLSVVESFPKTYRSVLALSRLSRAFRRRIGRYWHSLGCREIELGNPPQGRVVHAAVYGKCNVLKIGTMVPRTV